MNKKKVGRILLISVLLSSAWLPTAINFSSARIGAMTEGQPLEVTDEHSAEEVPPEIQTSNLSVVEEPDSVSENGIEVDGLSEIEALPLVDEFNGKDSVLASGDRADMGKINTEDGLPAGRAKPSYPSFQTSPLTTILDMDGNVVRGSLGTYRNRAVIGYHGDNQLNDITLNDLPFKQSSSASSGEILRMKNGVLHNNVSKTLAMKFRTDVLRVELAAYGALYLMGNLVDREIEFEYWIEEENGDKVVEDDLVIVFSDYGPPSTGGSVSTYTSTLLTNEKGFYNFVGSEGSNIGVTIGELSENSVEIINTAAGGRQVTYLQPVSDTMVYRNSWRVLSTGDLYTGGVTNLTLFSSNNPILMPIQNKNAIPRDTLNEDNFKMKMEIEQFIITQARPKFYMNPLQINIQTEDFIDIESGISSLEILDEGHNNIISSLDVEVINNEISIKIPAEVQKNLTNSTLSITGEFDIKPSLKLSEMLDAYNMINIPYRAKNNDNSSYVSAVAKVKAQLLADSVPQTVLIGSSTNDLVLENLLKNIQSFFPDDVVNIMRFSEQKIFEELGEFTVGVIIESTLSGIQSTIDVPITVINNYANVFVEHVDMQGNRLAETEVITGIVGMPYKTQSKNITNYRVNVIPENATGIFTLEDINVVYKYDIVKVEPLDPLNPEIEVDPNNKPNIPENQGLLSIDFVSQFDFGTSHISVSSQTYNAKPQRLLNEDGSVNLVEERPNFVQISDRRLATDRAGWELSVTQASQFINSNEEELRGAQLKLENQQLVTAQGGTVPELVRGGGLSLVPGSRQSLLLSQGEEGTGTWIYRFGDANTGAESVKLEVPEGANPSATTYRTTLIWELSAVPQN